MDIELPPDFKGFLSLLRTHGVEYLLIGGYALQDKNVVRMGIPPMRIEIITTISGVTFDECYTSRVVDVIDGIEVNLISLRHLKVNKKASGRHRDLDDLEHLP